MIPVIACLLVSCGGDNGSVDIIEGNELVYIDNGSIQCETEGVSVDETAELLMSEGIDVVFSYCGYLTGIDVLAQCGVSDLDINLHEINSQELAAAELIGFISVSALGENPELAYVFVDSPE